MKKNNKFLSIFLCLALIMSIIPVGYISASAETSTSSGRDGKSEETAFLISTVQDLEALWHLVNTGNHFEGMFFKQTANIEVNNFLPIGDSNNHFNGSYDGGNYSINGTIGSKSKKYQALFGVVGDKGTIKNVINNADVKGADVVGGIVADNYGTITNCYNKGAVEGANDIGGIVGYNDGTIENCYNTGEVTGQVNVGGVAGDNYGTIENCYNTGDVEGDGSVGGVAGGNYFGTIENCYNTGKITGTEDVGGVAGDNGSDAKITNCYNTGAVEGTGNYVGGVAGEDYGTIENCYNTGNVEGDGDYVGGVVGYNDGGTIANCYYNNEVCTAGDYSEVVEGKDTAYMKSLDFVGDLNTWVSDNNDEDKYLDWVTFGGYPILRPFEEDGTSTNPYQISTEGDLINLAQIVNNGGDCKDLFFKQTADITVTDFVPIGWYDNNKCDTYYFNGIYDGDNHQINGTIGDKTKDYQALFGVVGRDCTIKNLINNANVKGNYIVGGVVGYNNLGTITHCYNIGAIEGTDEYVGGVVGKNQGTIKCCFNIGAVKGKEKVGGVAGYCRETITNCYNAGYIEGKEEIGGVVGYNEGTITNCFSIGGLKSTGEYIGGVASNNTRFGEIINCYYNKDVYTAEDDTDGVAGKTTLEMSTQDFVDLLNGEGEKVFSYKPDDEDNIYYPYLTSFGEDSAVVSKEKVEYPITEGDNQKVEIGADGTLAFTSEGEFDKFKALYLGDEIKKENLVADTNYTAVSGSTKITLNADYVKTLPLGKQTFTLKFVDGYSVVNLEVIPQSVVEDNKTDDTDKPTADDNKPSTDDTTDDTSKPVVDDTENPKTDANSNFAFISILALISVAGAYGVKRKLSK